MGRGEELFFSLSFPFFFFSLLRFFSSLSLAVGPSPFNDELGCLLRCQNTHTLTVDRSLTASRLEEAVHTYFFFKEKKNVRSRNERAGPIAGRRQVPCLCMCGCDEWQMLSF